jgi:hypothetical protein
MVDEQIFVDGVLDEEPTKLPRIEPSNYRDNLDVETLVEQICDELGSAVDHAVVDRVVQDMVSRYRHARVKSFVPIFVKRDAMDLLRRS